MSSGTVRDGNLNHSCLDLFIMYLANENMVFVLLEFFLQVPKFCRCHIAIVICQQDTLQHVSRTHQQMILLSLSVSKIPCSMSAELINR